VSDIEINHALIAATPRINLPAALSDDWVRLYAEPLARWAPLAVETYQPWDGRPGAGHFYGGSYWYGLESSYTAFIVAVCYRAVKALGLECATPAERLLETAVGAVRYLGFTHMSGPEDCVRVDGPNPHCAKRKWGESHPTLTWPGMAFFMSSQTGGSVVGMGMAAMLLWDEIDDETRQLALNVAEWYADRWCDEPPKVGTYYDTQIEENGWTAHALDFAACIMPEHPRQERWRQAADWWIANIIVTPYDCGRNHAELQGKPVREWTVGATTHPDFTAENHDFVHPSYMASGLGYTANIMLHHRIAGYEPPEVCRLNREALYRTLKLFAERDGALGAVQSMDWWYLTHYHNSFIHAGMNVLFGDVHAAYLERECAANARRIVDSLPAGHLYTPDPGAYKLNQYQSMRTAERGAMNSYAQALLLHWVLGDGVEPCAADEFSEWQQGAYVFENGGTALRNGENSRAALSWRNRPVVIVQPRAGSWAITPHPTSLAGTFVCDPPRSSAMRELANTVRADCETMCAFSRVERTAGAIIQYLALVAPCDDVAYYFDTAVAAGDVTITEQRSGEVGVRNEDYFALPGVAPGRRTLFSEGGEFRSASGLGPEDEWFRTQMTDWVNVDDQIGYIVFGSKGIAYQAKHVYPSYTGMEDFLMLSYSDERTDYAAGDTISSIAAAIYPNELSEQTRNKPGSVLRAAEHRSADAILTATGLAAVNRSRHRAQLQLHFEPKGWDMLPVPYGATASWNGRILSYTLVIDAFSAVFLPCGAALSSYKPWSAHITTTGLKFVKLADGETGELDLMVDGEVTSVHLWPGRFEHLEL
jgi:hypothetical protein